MSGYTSSYLLRKETSDFVIALFAAFFAFQPIGGPTTMNINISGLPPNTIHGFHIHEFGDIASKGELIPSMLNTNGPMPKFS